MYYPVQTQTTPAPVFLSFPPKRGTQVASYGRKKRSYSAEHSESFINQQNYGALKNVTQNGAILQGGILANEHDMYDALIMLTEGFAKHSSKPFSSTY